VYRVVTGVGGRRGRTRTRRARRVATSGGGRARRTTRRVAASASSVRFTAGRVAAKTVVAGSGHFEDVRSRRREKREKGFADKVDIPESKPQAGWKEVSVCGKRKQES
jgi:hypothetical protein